MFGHAPVKKIVLGATNKQKKAFESHITSRQFQEKFSAENYDVLRNNCNNFVREAINYILEESSLSHDVEEILNNTKIISTAPKVKALFKLVEKGKTFSLNFMSKLMKTSNVEQDTEAFENIISIFSRPSALKALKSDADAEESEKKGEKEEHEGSKFESDGEVDSVEGSEEEIEIEYELTPEDAITSVLEFFESFSNPERKMSPPQMSKVQREKKKKSLPPGAKDAAVSFGKNMVDAIKLINVTLTSAIDIKPEDRKESSDTVVKSKAPIKHIVTMPRSQVADTVPVQEEVKVFLAAVFNSPYEALVLRKVQTILAENGYYELKLLATLTEEEMLQIGIKRGWAKKLYLAIKTKLK